MNILKTSRRGVLTLGALLFAGQAAASAQPCKPSRVLFVCPAGTVKSAIARETLERRAAQRGVAVHVQARGVHPEDHVSPALAARLKADGIEPWSSPILQLEAYDIVASDIVIAFDEAAQAPGMDRARPWNIPSWNADYDSAKAELAIKVDALVDELAANRCGP